MIIEQHPNGEHRLSGCTTIEAAKYCKQNGRELVEVRSNRKGTIFITQPFKADFNKK